MNIYDTIREARLKAGLTQEQAAEQLGVSRQTISNWENARTWPDIVSVVRMSDLYGVSLDLLLKGEEPMTDYLQHLKQSTDTVESNRRRNSAGVVLVYLLIWTAALMLFRFFTGPTDAMAYSLLVLWFLMPVTIFTCSLLIGRNDFWGRRGWLSAPVFGSSFALLEWRTFGLANQIATYRIAWPRISFLLAGAAIAAAGLLLGSRLRKRADH